MRLRQEIQEMLRPQLTVPAVLTEGLRICRCRAAISSRLMLFVPAAKNARMSATKAFATSGGSSMVLVGMRPMLTGLLLRYTRHLMTGLDGTDLVPDNCHGFPS